MLKMIKRFFKRLMCFHSWTDENYYVPTLYFNNVGFKDWRTDTSIWGCSQCGKVKTFRYSFIPIERMGPYDA